MISMSLNRKIVTRRRTGMPRWILPLALALLLLAPLLGVGIIAVQRSAADEQAMATFVAANRLYDTGKIALAQQAYTQLRSQNVGGVEVLYNLALTQIQLQDIQGAHTTLQEAARLAPRAADVAVLQNEVQAAALAQGIILPDADASTLPLSLNELSLLALLAWSITGALIVAALWTRKSFVRVAAAVVGAIALGVTLFGLMQLLP